MKKRFFLPLHWYVKTLLYTSVLKLASFLKVSFIIGSYCSFFSVCTDGSSLAGAFNATIPALLSLLLVMAVKVGAGLSLSWTSIALAGIPSFFGSLVWSHGRLASFMVPVLCMGFYLAHPDSSLLYASLWLIPTVISATNTTHVFLRSLASTFVAHAVGAVIWAYTVPMTCAAWNALAPLALVERIVFAAGMSVLYGVAQAFAKVLHTRTSLA